MKHLLIIIFSVAAIAAKAQTGFTLQQSIDYTLQHHPSIAVYENNTAITKAQATQTNAGYLPQVSGSATTINNLQLQTTVLPAGIIGADPKEIELGTKYNSNASVDVSQTIFDKSKILAMKANKPAAELSNLQQQQNKEDLMYATASAYFQVLIYQEQLSILQTNKHKYEEMLKVLQHQYEKGTVLEKDVDRVQVNLNTTNYQIQDATTKEQLALNTLKNAMGMPLENNLSIQNNMHYESFANNTTAQDSLTLDNLTEVKMNDQTVALQEFNLKIKQATVLPTLSAVSKFGTQSLSNDFSGAYNNWNSFSYVGLSLNVPIFTGLKRSGQITEEKLKLKNEELNFSINKENLKLRFDNAKTSVGTSYSSYQSNKENMELAGKLLDVTDYQYQHGVASLPDYLNDDAAYKEAQSNYIGSLYNLMISQLNYQKSQGKIAEFISEIN